MISAISASLFGLNDATSRFNRASQRLIESTSGVSDSDPESAVADQIEATVQFKASAATLKSADEMTQSLLNIVV